MMDRVVLEGKLIDINKQIDIVTRQIENSDYNITGLVAQKTRHMDRRDMLEGKKAELETQLAALPPEEPQA